MTITNKEIDQADSCVKPEVEFSVLFRLQHWIRVAAIVVLIATGFYIAVPMLSPIPNAEPTNFMYALFRTWHVVFGFVLIGVILIKSYLFLFSKDEAGERRSIIDLINPIVWFKQIGYYLLMSKRPRLKGMYNPIQFLAYLAFYVMVFGLIITGLILYVHVYHEGLGGLLYEPMRAIEVMIGGLAVVRELHHILMWGVIIFIVYHVYLVIFNAVYIKEGAMDAIFSGLKWHKKD